MVSTDFLGKEPHRQVDVDSVVTSGSLGGVMVSTLAWNASDVDPIPALGAIFPIFITPVTLVAMSMILYKLHAVWSLNLPCVRLLPYVCNCKH